MGNSFSMPSVIGLLMLMGIVTKNSILLVDYLILGLHEHGMLPTALGLGADPSFRAPRAIVLIGGLIASTFLSLLVVPVMFTLVDDVLKRIRRLFGHPAI